MPTAPGPDLAAVIDGLIRRHGSGLLDDRRRLHGLLRDYAPGAVREIAAVVAAHEAGVAGRLRDESSPLDSVPRETETLAGLEGWTRETAAAAASTWARGLAASRVAVLPVSVQRLPESVPATRPDEASPFASRRLRVIGGLAVALVLLAIALRLLGQM